VISTRDVVQFLGSSVQRVVNSREFPLSGVGALASAGEGELVFCSGTGPEAVQAICVTSASVVICRGDVLARESEWRANAMLIGVEDPRLAFVRTYRQFFETPIAPSVHPTVVVGQNCMIDASVAIGPHATIGNDVSIGSATRIGPGVFVADGTRIGAECTIHANAVIGEPGFGFERDDAGRAIPFPHLGRVIIGDRVAVGAQSCIARGALSDTIIEDDVQIDSHVHVAHNVRIHKAATIVAHSSISGSAEIEERAWLSPGTLIMGQMTVGADAKVGVGSVVTKPVKPRVTVFGNPARTVWSGR